MKEEASIVVGDSGDVRVGVGVWVRPSCPETWAQSIVIAI